MCFCSPCSLLPSQEEFFLLKGVANTFTSGVSAYFAYEKRPIVARLVKRPCLERTCHSRRRTTNPRTVRQRIEAETFKEQYAQIKPQARPVERAPFDSVNLLRHRVITRHGINTRNAAFSFEYDRSSRVVTDSWSRNFWSRSHAHGSLVCPVPARVMFRGKGGEGVGPFFPPTWSGSHSCVFSVAAFAERHGVGLSDFCAK